MNAVQSATGHAKIDGIIAVLAADVHVLAEDRRLLRQIAKVLDGFQIARIIADLLALPGLERVGTAAADLQMMAGGARKPPAGWRPAASRLVDVAADPGGDLQHAFGDVMFGLSDAQPDVVDQREVLAQVVTRRIDHLQLQFDTEGKGIGAVKIG
jgi:hypothetical protein